MREYFISRRNLLKSAIIGLVSVLTSREVLAATPVIKIGIAKRSTTEITFSVEATETVKCYLEYGYAKDSLKNKSAILSISKKSPKNIVVSALTPGTVLFYRVRYLTSKSKSYLATQISSIKTDQVLSTNTFAIQADPHMDQNSSEEVYLGTLKEVVKTAPAFLMDLGDIFMVDKLQDKSEKNIRDRFELMKGYYGNLGNVPLKITLGNHDGELGYSKFNTKNFRKEYFPEQTGELAYYSFEGPGQLHIVLDPFTYTTENPKDDGWQWTLGRVQYDWLVKTLQASTAPHKFIYIHHLLVGNAQSRGGVEIAHLNEWGGKSNDGSYGFDQYRPGWGKPIHTLLVENKVGFVFKGHDHLYVKQELDGIIYQTLPQPSHPGDKLDVRQYGYLSGKGVGGSGFLKVRTEGALAYVDFIKFDGSMGDSYTREAI
ncbi:MAG: hypothetical protein EBT44_06515 [Actinobacteria bacterium]|uniref:Calcineurin-like phosphoesterase domain-containing protein n=1 Tax=Candidatus Fonsibacter lacus TaxID=2576439 RepID=A0A965GDQ0_9PROT|nr:hypothetical protein [Candidatus Fonsibacter lacus]